MLVSGTYLQEICNLCCVIDINKIIYTTIRIICSRCKVVSSAINSYRSRQTCKVKHKAPAYSWALYARARYLATTLAPLLYAAPAWRGVALASDRECLQCLHKKTIRMGYLCPTFPPIPSHRPGLRKWPHPIELPPKDDKNYIPEFFIDPLCIHLLSNYIVYFCLFVCFYLCFSC